MRRVTSGTRGSDTVRVGAGRDPSQAGRGKMFRWVSLLGASTATPSSSGPAFPVCTSSTACGRWARRSGCSRPAPASAAPGTGTAIRAAASIPRATPTATPSARSCWTNGAGPSISRPSPRPSATSTTSPTSSTCAGTSSSRAGSRRRSSTRPTARGRSPWRTADPTGPATWSPPPARCPRRPCRGSRASTTSRARPITPASGPSIRSASRESGWR